LHAGGALAGSALTVRIRRGDNLMIHKALVAEPGDVIVVDGGGDLTNALVGELTLSHTIKIGIAGVVVDSAIRDYGWVKTDTFPVFAAGITHRGPYKDGPGEFNVPVAIDGMVIEPGDLVIGDDDGLLCVPYGQTEAIYALAREKTTPRPRAPPAQWQASLHQKRGWMRSLRVSAVSGLTVFQRPATARQRSTTAVGTGIHDHGRARRNRYLHATQKRPRLGRSISIKDKKFQ
jgi:regulator of RNase E activity RraA